MSDITKTFANFGKMMGNNINVSMFGKISNYYERDNTADIEIMSNNPNTGKPYAPLIKIPIGIFGLGGFNIKIKPKIGDWVILIFMDYSIDYFITDGHTKDLNSTRTHALEDAIALPIKINFLNNTYNTNEGMEINNNDGTATIQMFENGDVKLKYNRLFLGKNATRKVLLDDTNGYTTSKNIFAE